MNHLIIYRKARARTNILVTKRNEGGAGGERRKAEHKAVQRKERRKEGYDYKKDFKGGVRWREGRKVGRKCPRKGKEKRSVQERKRENDIPWKEVHFSERSKQISTSEPHFSEHHKKEITSEKVSRPQQGVREPRRAAEIERKLAMKSDRCVQSRQIHPSSLDTCVNSMQSSFLS